MTLLHLLLKQWKWQMVWPDLFRRKVNNEDNMDPPMFFGFVGIFTALLAWPGIQSLLLCKKMSNADTTDVDDWSPLALSYMFNYTLSGISNALTCINLIQYTPGFFLFDFSGIIAVQGLGVEHFDWPTSKQLEFLVVNGLIGTVLSELLWLCGCFYTSR